MTNFSTRRVRWIRLISYLVLTQLRRLHEYAYNPRMYQNPYVIPKDHSDHISLSNVTLNSTGGYLPSPTNDQLYVDPLVLSTPITKYIELVGYDSIPVPFNTPESDKELKRKKKRPFALRNS
jgi:hypothetical protein